MSFWVMNIILRSGEIWWQTYRGCQLSFLTIYLFTPRVFTRPRKIFMNENFVHWERCPRNFPEIAGGGGGKVDTHGKREKMQDVMISKHYSWSQRSQLDPKYSDTVKKLIFYINFQIFSAIFRNFCGFSNLKMIYTTWCKLKWSFWS